MASDVRVFPKQSNAEPFCKFLRWVTFSGHGPDRLEAAPGPCRSRRQQENVKGATERSSRSTAACSGDAGMKAGIMKTSNCLCLRLVLGLRSG